MASGALFEFLKLFQAKENDVLARFLDFSGKEYFVQDGINL